MAYVRVRLPLRNVRTTVEFIVLPARLPPVAPRVKLDGLDRARKLSSDSPSGTSPSSGLSVVVVEVARGLSG